MPRRLASQVHLTASRLLKANVLQTTPAWYNAVLQYPPIPLPPRDTPPRAKFWREVDLRPDVPDHNKIPFDLPINKFTPRAVEQSRRAMRTRSPRPEAVEYTEDRIRRQFFKDHPFEAYRPRTLTEQGTIEEEHPIRGREWTRLRQHGRNPTSEDAIKFAVNLYENHVDPVSNQPMYSLSEAYHRAVAQFRSLRSEHDIESRFALNEALFYGAEFAPNETRRGYNLTKRALLSWSQERSRSARKAAGIAKRFFPVYKGRLGVENYWSRGVGYTRRWQKGMPPMLWPSREEREVQKARRREAEAPLREARELAARSVGAKVNVKSPWLPGAI